MGFVSVLKLAVTTFDVLAWPLFAVCYPLCASIRAIEVNSNADTKKLIAYWVSFSLILLFEHLFEKLLDWLPSWPYVKLMIVCCLVIPYFDGSVYVYEHLVHPCLSMDAESVINQIIRLKDFVFKEDNLPAEMERCVKENGPDGLENVIAPKPKFEKIKIARKGINAVETTGEIRMTSAQQGTCVAPLEIEKPATTVEAGKDIPASEQVQKQWTCAICQLTVQSETVLDSHLQGKRHKAACERLNAKKQIPKSEATPASMGKKPINVPLATAAASCRDHPATPLPSKIAQKDWSCPICKTNSKNYLDARSHVLGKRHKAACELLQAKDGASKSNVWPVSVGKSSDTTEGEPGTCASNTENSSGIHEETKQLGKQESPENRRVNTVWRCTMCNVSCTSQGDLDSHFGGSKHFKRIQELVGHT